MTVVCVSCSLIMKPSKTGAFVEEMLDGKSPYRLVAGDAYRCSGCGTEVVTRFATSPVAEHYQSDYAKKVEAFTPHCRAYPGVQMGAPR